LSSEQHEAFLKNPRFLGMKFPELAKPETLEKVIHLKIDLPRKNAKKNFIFT